MHTYKHFQDHGFNPTAVNQMALYSSKIIQVMENEPFKGETFTNMLFHLAASKYKQCNLLYILRIYDLSLKPPKHVQTICAI